jgi:hypothetical protein
MRFNLAKKRANTSKNKGKVMKRLTGAKKATRQKIHDAESLLLKRFNKNPIKQLEKIAKNYGFKTEAGKDFGFGTIDLVLNIRFHPALDPITCGFIKLKEQEGGSRDLQDGQFSLRKIEEAIMIGMRSGMERTYLVCDNDDIGKSVTGQIEWLASFGSLIRIDGYSAGISSLRESKTRIVPS